MVAPEIHIPDCIYGRSPLTFKLSALLGLDCAPDRLTALHGLPGAANPRGPKPEFAEGD